MPGTDALLDHRGWWTRGPGGYEGPSPIPPAGPAPRRVALADVRVQTLVASPAHLDAEIQAAFGPASLVVTQDLGEYRQQCFGAEESGVARAETWSGVGLMAPYPLAVQAWLAAQGPRAPNESQAIVERLGDTLLITVCQGSRILAYRQAESEPGGSVEEVRRTLLGIGARAGSVRILLVRDLLPLGLPDFPADPLPASCVALDGLARLGRRARFVSREAARVFAAAAQRKRLHRRAMMAGAAATLGGLAWVGGWFAHQEADATHRRLVAEAAQLQRKVDRLAPRKLGALVRPLPLDRIGNLLASLPPGAGLVEAVVEPEGAHTRLVLRFRPVDPLLKDPWTLETVLKSFASLTDLEIRPSLSGDGQVFWEGHAHVEEGRSR